MDDADDAVTTKAPLMELAGRVITGPDSSAGMIGAVISNHRDLAPPVKVLPASITE